MYEEEGKQGMEGKTMKERFRAWVTVNAHGPYAVPILSVFSFAEAIFFPIPVDVLLIPLVVVRARSWIYYAAVASITSVFGGAVGYAIGFFLFDLIGAHIVSFYSLQAELALVQSWLMNNTFSATLVSAFTPIPYKVFTITAGLFSAPFFVFLLASLIGRSLRYVLVCYIAHKWGTQLAQLFLRNFKIATVLVIGSAIILYFLLQI